MPLKHATETFYFALLAVAIALTGMALAWLPPLPRGLFPWTILLAVTGIYPLLLAPTLKHNRADYEFRRMHVFPFAIVMIWGLLNLAELLLQINIGVIWYYTFLWSIGPVVLGLGLLVWFAISVVRRAQHRLTILGVIAAVFLVGAIGTHIQGINGTIQREIAKSSLGQNGITMFLARALPGITDGTDVAMNDDTSSSAMSDDSSETSSSSSDADEDTSSSSSTSSARSSRSSASSVSSIDDMEPPHLPESGGEVGILALLMGSLYSGVMHRRAKRRQ